MLISFCLGFASNVDARESAGDAATEKRNHFFFFHSSDMVLFRESHLAPADIVTMNQLRCTAILSKFPDDLNKSALKGPLKHSLPSIPSTVTGSFFTAHSRLHVIKASGPVRLRPICRIDCHTKRERMVHLSQPFAVQAVFCGMQPLLPY